MKIGVTGATGHLGRLVVEKLKQMGVGQDVAALVRSTLKAADLGVEAREFDYTAPENLANALIDIDKLLLISSSEIGQRALHHANVINAAKKAGVKSIVYTSLLHADNTSIGLAGEHLATEAALKTSGIEHVILRNGWYTENYTAAVQGALASGAIVGSAGEGKIASAARVDFAEAAAVVITSTGHAGKVYELAGDSAYTLTELAAEISKQSGKKITYKNLSETEYTKILKSFNVPEGLAQIIAGWDVSASKGDLFDDSHQLSKLIGRTTTPLSQSVAVVLAK